MRYDPSSSSYPLFGNPLNPPPLRLSLGSLYQHLSEDRIALDNCSKWGLEISSFSDSHPQDSYGLLVPPLCCGHNVSHIASTISSCHLPFQGTRLHKLSFILSKAFGTSSLVGAQVLVPYFFSDRPQLSLLISRAGDGSWMVFSPHSLSKLSTHLLAPSFTWLPT